MKLQRRRLCATSFAAMSLCAALAAPAHAAISVTPTTAPADLAGALQGSGVNINAVSISNGAASQFGTYSGFNGSVITLGDGVVMSTGRAADTPHPVPGQVLNTGTNAGGTSEYDAYGAANVTNFVKSYDVAAMSVTFTLDSSSAVAFSFVFGSMEYPDFVNEYTDAFVTFLDGTSPANQIVFDAAGHPVQVGSSFASALSTADTSTAFQSPQGLIGVLTTTTGTLSAGTHILLFEIGDVNDDQLDSAVFLTNLHATAGGGSGPVTSPIPEPGSLALLMAGLLVTATAGRRRASR